MSTTFQIVRVDRYHRRELPQRCRVFVRRLSIPGRWTCQWHQIVGGGSTFRIGTHGLPLDRTETLGNLEIYQGGRVLRLCEVVTGTYRGRYGDRYPDGMERPVLLLPGFPFDWFQRREILVEDGELNHAWESGFRGPIR
ncbi:hypothetical protein CA13_03000 [Planctomycetes bacterium CA13]|uniref:Uncharacterized protein n=1 Tax=Novipirellula herctigrandis TaxID=2527986 RepID=A0A5C5YWE0_9BACT|nr:hypothetical protein CA13_03000 [Planctomycetes bacterium CA13]